MTSPIDAGATPAVTALLQQLRDGREADAAAQQILQITAGLDAKLRQRDADVAAAIRELESFSYSVSHDLRAPLSTIDGFSRLLEGSSAKGDVERSKHYLQRLRLGVANINELIAALLLMSRLLRAPMVPQAVDIGALAQAALTDLQATEPARVAQVEVQAGLMAHGDPTLLKQLMDHLVGNAWKFSAKKDWAVITVGTQSGAGGQTIFFVRDNGAGFDMAHADKLFGIFQRMHVTSDFPGLGAGLAMAQRIVARHGGKIWAEAAVEEGATVYFTLPGV